MGFLLPWGEHRNLKALPKSILNAVLAEGLPSGYLNPMSRPPFKKSSPEKSTKILTGFRLDTELKTRANLAAAQENRSLSNYIETLISRDVLLKNLK